MAITGAAFVALRVVSPGAMCPRPTGCSTSSSAGRGQGAGPVPGPVTVDVDSSICETYGLAEQGARFGHTNVRGYHRLLATMAGTDDVVGVRLRGGSSHTGRGAAGFLTQVFNRVRRAGASGRWCCGPTPVSTPAMLPRPVASQM